MGRVMIERPASVASRDADIRSYPVKAGESVVAGDVVDVVGGSVGAAWQGKPNGKNVIYSSQLDGTSMVRINDAISAACMIVGNHVFAKKINNLDGAGVGDVANVAPSSAPSQISSARISDTAFILGSIESNLFRVRHVTITDAGMTPGNPNNVSSGSVGSTGYGQLIDLGDKKVLGVYNENGVKANVLNFSAGVSIGAQKALPGSTSAAYISATRLPDSGSNKRVCVCYQDAADGYKGKAVIATISASNVVTWGTPVPFETSFTVSSINVSFDGAYIVLTYKNHSNNYVYCRLLDSSTVSPAGDALRLGRTNPSRTASTVVGGKIVATYSTDIAGPEGNEMFVVVGRSGQALTKGPVFTLSTRTDYLSLCEVDDAGLIACYGDILNSYCGTATLLEVRGDQIAGSFENISSQAIALQSGTGGQSIDVVFDGTAELPGITAGTSITSPGVQGYSPQDGWLWVRPEWDGAAITGRYIGTGTYGVGSKNELVLPQGTKMVIVLDAFDRSLCVIPVAIGSGVVQTFVGTNYAAQAFEFSGGILSWYAKKMSIANGGSGTMGAQHQFNLQGRNYDYLAIG